MKIFSTEFIENLREKVDTIQVLKKFLILAEADDRFETDCPFCEDKRSSFCIFKGDKFYNCNNCFATGDALAFLMTHKMMTFKNAILFLAEEFKIPLEESFLETEKVNHEKCVDLYHSLGRQDRHVINLLHWIAILENLSIEVGAAEQDQELEDELRSIIKKLINEVGVRVHGMFVGKIVS